MMIRAWLLLGSWLACGCVADAGSTPPKLQNANAVLEEVNHKGASAVVRNIFRKPAWEEILENIASGETVWIDVAIALRSGTDAGSTSELVSAMFLALGKNPAYILQSAEPRYSLSDICEGRVDFPPVYQEARAEYVRIREAVEKVQESDLQFKKKACLNKLREGERHMKRSFGIEGE